ncbi:D-alanyl-D-alanine carboxypeptidase family protein [Neobacillus sp. LXY-1]|uniref:D-alanyl-D-alanine carboxypeptidase family protein n=1 Tax=Neobacillus sp. LXY-1 TaxID=3379133 RepID=UPI003EE3ED5B
MFYLYKIGPIILAILMMFSFQQKVSAEENDPLGLKSEAAVLMDTDTNAVLYAKNPDEKLFPASVTKIATAIYAIEKGRLNDIVTVSANAVNQDGTRVYLVEGEQVPLKKLIQGMLINSGNDAAIAIAEYLDGNVEKFSENINEFLKTKIGVTNTHFMNPNGLHDPNHYTTARDLALITNYAMKNPVFAEIFGTKFLPWEGKAWNTTLVTHHIMLKGEMPYPGITGGKTGYTTDAKQTLATTANNGNIKLTAIVLRSDGKMAKYEDTARLFDYGFKEYKRSTLNHGERFTVDHEEFYLEKDTPITEDNNGIIKKVSSNGILSIEKNDGQVLQQVQLKHKEPKPKIKLVKNEKSKEKDQLPYISAIFGVMLLGGVLVLFNVKKKATKRF